MSKVDAVWVSDEMIDSSMKPWLDRFDAVWEGYIENVRRACREEKDPQRRKILNRTITIGGLLDFLALALPADDEFPLSAYVGLRACCQWPRGVVAGISGGRSQWR